MASVTTKSLILSQPKAGQGEGGISIPTLPHTTQNNEFDTIVKVEIPGVDPSKVEVEFNSNSLTVICDRGKLNVPVDPTIDTSKIKADIQWGLLTLTIPVPTPPPARSIKISIHDAVKGTSRSKVTEEN